MRRRIETRVEGRPVEPEVVGQRHQPVGLQRPLVGEQQVVVLPVAVLVAGAVRRLGRLEGVGMDLRQRKVLPDDPQAIAVGSASRFSVGTTCWQNGQS
jgi:hypothetical protein